MKQFDRANLKALEFDLERVLAAVGAKHGIKIERKSGRFSASQFSFMVEAQIIDESGASVAEKYKWYLYCGMFGLEKDQFGTIFYHSRDAYEITGVNPRAPKFPINAKRVSDGRLMRFQAGSVRSRKLAA